MSIVGHHFSKLLFFHWINVSRIWFAITIVRFKALRTNCVEVRSTRYEIAHRLYWVVGWLLKGISRDNWTVYGGRGKSDFNRGYWFLALLILLLQKVKKGKRFVRQQALSIIDTYNNGFKCLCSGCALYSCSTTQIGLRNRWWSSAHHWRGHNS